jgi:hypothetical protein
VAAIINKICAMISLSGFVLLSACSEKTAVVSQPLQPQAITPVKPQSDRLPNGVKITPYDVEPIVRKSL